MHVYTCIYIYIYIYRERENDIYIYIYIYIYIDIDIYIERDGEREGERPIWWYFVFDKQIKSLMLRYQMWYIYSTQHKVITKKEKRKEKHLHGGRVGLKVGRSLREAMFLRDGIQIFKLQKKKKEKKNLIICPIG